MSESPPPPPPTHQQARDFGDRWVMENAANQWGFRSGPKIITLYFEPSWELFYIDIIAWN